MHRIQRILLFFVTGTTLLSCSQGGVKVNVQDFGAKGDGIAIDSPAINSAIEEAALTGGTVLIPAGTYNCYSIRLKSNITLEFEDGAVIKAAQYTDSLGFDDAEPNPYAEYQDFGHNHFHNSLIWGEDLENVTLCGKGFIDGSLMSNGLTDRRESTGIDLDFRLKKGVANKALSLKECRNIVVRDLTLYRCGHFCILATGVEGLVLENLIADSQRDGFDIDCCVDVTVKGCCVNTPWDDAIVLKSSYTLGRYIDCDNISISDCDVSGYEVGTMLDGTRKVPDTSRRKNPNIRCCGRIKLGTESSGGFRNVDVSNCRLNLSGGLHVETTDGGDVENISFRDITIDRCEDAPVFVMIGSRLRSPEGREVGSIRNVSFKNIVSTNAKPDYGVVVTGYRTNKVENVSFENVLFQSRGGLSSCDAVGSVIEMEKEYPDPKTFGVMPSKGMYLRHVNGVRLSGVKFEYLSEDGRPEILTEDVENMEKEQKTSYEK